MKIRTTLILLVVVALLGAGIIILDKVMPGSREPESVYVFNFDPKNVNALDISRGESSMKFQSNDDRWKMITPLQDQADPDVIDQILRAAQLLHRDDLITNLGRGDQRRKKLKSFGLLKSKLVLKLHGTNLQARFEFGNNTAVGGKCYLMLNGKDPVFIVPDELKSLLLKDEDDYRDHKLLSFPTGAIDHITLKSANGQIALSKQQNSWQIDQPIRTHASDSIVDSILDKIDSFEIQSFLTSDKAGNTGLDTTTRSILLRAGDEKAELNVGNLAGTSKVYAQISDRSFVLTLDSSIVKLFDLMPNDLRDRKLAHLNPDMIDRITIETESLPKLILSRHENQWNCISNRNLPINSKRVQTLIDNINQQDVSAFVTDSAANLDQYGLSHPHTRITFSAYSSENTAEEPAGEAPLVVLDIGRSENGITYVRIEPGPYVMSIPQKSVEELPLTETDFH